MATWPNPWLPLLLVAALLAFEDWLSTPSCSSGPPAPDPASGDLRAMMVADLVLVGSDATFADRFFRDHVTSKLFTKSIQTTNPDMIIVLGDISARGSEQNESKWIAVLEQFEGILGQYSSLPVHIVLGDKDVGGCSSLDGNLVHRMAKHLPGLDSSGCGTFEISNTSFMSLNAVALLCGDNMLRFSVEKVLEEESRRFRKRRLNGGEHSPLGSENKQNVGDYSWRQNRMTLGSGPVLLLHIPLHKSQKSDKGVTGVPMFPDGTVSDHPLVSPSSKQSGVDGRRLYDRSHTLPANSTEYILQALKPRIIFSAHADSFSDYTHPDGTREVTVPAMTWKKGGMPGFVIATFGENGVVSVNCCWLVQEWACWHGQPLHLRTSPSGLPVTKIGEQSLKMSSPPAPGGSTPQRRCTSDPGSRWASLPEDLARMVAFRLLAGDLLDYVRFRAVCTGWRSGTESPRGRGVSDPRFHPRRWMMLPEGHGLYPGRPELDGHVRFLNLDTGALVRARIPLLLEVDCIIDSVDGLLLLLRDADEEGGICLVHPFTGDTLELPPLRTLRPHLGSLFPSGYVPDSFRRLTRVVCASISFNAGAMAIMLELFDVDRLAYATSQDQEWTLSSWVCRRRYTPLPFQGKLYMVDTPSPGSCDENIHQVFQIDPPVQDGAGTVRQVQPPKLIATIPADKLVYPNGLVQCGSEILVIGHNEFYGSEFVVCKLSDLVLQRFIPIKNIGGYTLFVYERNKCLL